MQKHIWMLVPAVTRTLLKNSMAVNKKKWSGYRFVEKKCFEIDENVQKRPCSVPRTLIFCVYANISTERSHKKL